VRKDAVTAVMLGKGSRRRLPPRLALRSMMRKTR
jgi:hypothetical protein